MNEKRLLVILFALAIPAFARAQAGAAQPVAGTPLRSGDVVALAAKNTQLSEGRAVAVKTYLVANHGIRDDRLVVMGYGPSLPVASNNTKAGRAENRRIEFKVLSQ